MVDYEKNMKGLRVVHEAIKTMLSTEHQESIIGKFDVRDQLKEEFCPSSNGRKINLGKCTVTRIQLE